LSDQSRPDYPLAVIGHNAPPISEQMKLGYEALAEDATKAEAGANALPNPVTSADDVKLYADHAKIIKGVISRTTAAEEKEKRPFMDALDAVRGHFGQFTNKNGTGKLDKVLDGMRLRVKTWQDAEADRIKREAAEAARLKRLEEEAAMAAAAKAASELAAQEAARKAAEAAANAPATALAQEQAPPPDPEPVVSASMQVMEHLDAADRAGHGARVFEKVAEAKPSDHVRTRSAVGGGMATSGTFWDFEIIDLEAIPPASLWGFITDAEKTKAVAAFVRAHKNETPLPGVRIFQNTRAVFR